MSSRKNLRSRKIPFKEITTDIPTGRFENDGPRAYNDQYKRFGLVRNFRFADILTLLNSVCGAISIFSGMSLIASLDTPSLVTDLSLLTQHQLVLFRSAFLSPFIGLFFDIVDGKVARLLKSTSTLGQELDSLADLVTFGVAPAVLAFIVGLRTWIDILILCVFISCGVARLARYNVTTHSLPKTETGKSKFFQGLPIPSSLILILAIWAMFETGYFAGGVPGGSLLLLGNSVHCVSFLWLFWAICMVSQRLHVPKL